MVNLKCGFKPKVTALNLHSVKALKDSRERKSSQCVQCQAGHPLCKENIKPL